MSSLTAFSVPFYSSTGSLLLPSSFPWVIANLASSLNDCKWIIFVFDHVCAILNDSYSSLIHLHLHYVLNF
jgi:hypothetical protein